MVWFLGFGTIKLWNKILEITHSKKFLISLRWKSSYFILFCMITIVLAIAIVFYGDRLYLIISIIGLYILIALSYIDKYGIPKKRIKVYTNVDKYTFIFKLLNHVFKNSH